MLETDMKNAHSSRHLFGAGNGTRTRDLLLGKQALYQLSYTRRIPLIIGGTIERVKSGMMGVLVVGYRFLVVGFRYFVTMY